MSKALQDVAAERERQKAVEGWTAKHDDKHEFRELVKAAICYAMNAAAPFYSSTGGAPLSWPWSYSWWKPKDRRRDLIRAAALIVAEIERLDRKAGAA